MSSCAAPAPEWRTVHSQWSPRSRPRAPAVRAITATSTTKGMNKLVYIVVAALLVPIALLMAIVVAVGAVATSAGHAATVAATAVCTYANPDPERITAAMEQLTSDPVDRHHWDTYSPAAGLDPGVTFESSSLEQRHQVLLSTVHTVLNGTPPHSVTTPPMVWWHTTVPGDNDDTSWETEPVPGWDGTLASYIGAFVETYATNPVVLAAASSEPDGCLPPPGAVCPQPVNEDAILSTIRALESGDDFTESSHSRASGYPTSSGNPSGAYQYLYTSWNRYHGYDEAYQAPPAVQDARAAQDVSAVLARFGSVDWVPVAWYVGLGGAAKVRDGEWPLTYIPNPVYNHISIGDYQTKWMRNYTTIALPAVGVQPVDCPQGAEAVIAWAETQIGAPYAAIDPYRFGAPPWPGGTRTGSRGDLYTFAAGTVVYDCSGFVITAWRQAGVDFTGQYGIYGSQGFLTTRLLDAPRSALQPGDIAVYRPSASGIGHVVLIHHIDEATGKVATIEASPSYGVHIGTLNWSRVSAIKRPPQT